ncbi:MAG: sulfite exporter TauE/SafE family protein [Chloroflexota bacterium]
MHGGLSGLAHTPPLGPWQVAVLVGAAFLAGAVNAVAGGGSLISFPALLVVGYPALAANVTNTVALLPGYLGGTLAYRSELQGQRDRIWVLGGASLLGAVVGSVLLVVSSTAVFRQIVPGLIIFACGLLAVQPWVGRLVRSLQKSEGAEHHAVPFLIAQFLGSIYGAYFGAGMGVLMLAVLGIFLTDTLQRLNALKGLLSLVVTVVAALYFALFGPVVWLPAIVMAGASMAGGQVGVVVARRLSPVWLRGLVVVFGIVVAVRLLL